MADVAESFGGPPAVDQSGNLTIWWVPTIVNPNAPTVAEIGHATAFRLTYSFTPGGWALTIPQEKLPDLRLTSPQDRQSLGKTTPSLADLGYVDSVAAGSAAVVLASGGAGHFVERRNLSQDTLIAAAQKVRVIKCTLGVQVPGPTDGSGKFTLLQAAAVESVSALVAVAA
ncbi:MAG: hypothetical protein JWP85_2134 [Rhodoglobus sp.]|nr:hypothetical protein [Rhodoglobus sp.]